MSYGSGEYGQRGYGGSSFEAGGPSITASDPLNGATGVSTTAALSFTLGSAAGIDTFLLNVDVDGAQAIVGGLFQAGFTGTLEQDPETTITITFASHPAFSGGPTQVDIDATDLAGIQANLSFAFSVDDIAAVAETVIVSEAVTTHLDYHGVPTEMVTLTEGVVVSKSHDVEVSESLSISEEIETGSLLAQGLDGHTYKVSFPVEMRLDHTSDLAHFGLRPTDGGAGSVLVAANPNLEEYQTGTAAQVVNLPFKRSGLDLDFQGLEGFSSNILDFHGTATFGVDAIGDYIEILNGQGKGYYQIAALYTTNTIGLPAVPRVLVDRPILIDPPVSGYVEGVAEVVSVVGGTVTLRLPDISVGDPLVDVLYVEDRDTPGGRVNMVVTLIDHNTFSVQEAGEFSPSLSSERVFVIARVASKLEWRHVSGVQSITFTTSKLTGGATYLSTGEGLLTKTGAPYSFAIPFLATNVAKPRVLGGTYLEADGTLLVEYDQEMQVDDANLTNPSDYVIIGPSTVAVRRVYNQSSTVVGLEMSGLTAAGSYTLTVSTSTPKDVAGNPLDPTYNTVIFTAAVPETNRSVFTDKGPIAKPALTLQSGSNATLQTYNEVTLTGATLTSALIGQYVRLTGGAVNGGTFRIASIVSSTRAKLANASFSLPEANNGSLTWEVYDPRNGQIADDPADVVVRVNGTPVTPDAVVGLLGQVVLPTVPAENDDVQVDYSWCCNPTVEVRRLNSREFRLNAWNRDTGYPKDKSQHKYRYNNVLVRPSDYDPDDLSATLDQPELRELHYRAYERAYTPVLNDPSLLLLNSPVHRVAFPPAQRILTETFVNYEGLGLPESLATNAWTRLGTGIAVSASGYLTVTDNSTGDYPTGQPIFWTRPIDLSFPHVFAMSWRFSLDTVSTLDGVYTGVAAGYADEKVVVVVGYLDDGGTKKIGLLKRGSADNPAASTDWTGGLDSSSNATNAPADFDWDILHSYRIFRDLNGIISVYVDGETTPRLRASASELPFLEELPAPFDGIQGTFFGSLSRPAASVSTWDFVRYLITPTNPKQAAASSFVSYEANVVPEADAKPWTPVGYHGTETIQSTDFLLLESTSATDTATASDVGLVGGDYRGFVRFEPLLTQSSEFVADAQVQLLTHTHGVSPYGLTLAVDDGTQLMQLAWFSDQETPKISYGGRSLPGDFAPFSWQTSGTQSATMLGRTLRIVDASIADGRVYYHDDSEPVGDTRVVASSLDYILEGRLKVNSYTVDGSGFAGAFMQAFDGTRSVGLLLEVVAGTPRIAFQSDGVTISSVNFDWDDGEVHTYRLSKSTGGNLVSLFVDGTFLGSEAYSNFIAPVPDPVGQISFGSATPASVASLSSVDWVYCNAWRVRSDLKHYVGLWKGSDADSLLGYHLPLKASGRGAQVAGNTLGDANASFITAGVAAGDKLIVDAGANRGVYEVAGVGSGTSLTIVGVWPVKPSLVDYRIAKETDWTAMHKYRLTRDSTGEVAVLFDTDTEPLIRVSYNSIDLPISGVGVIKTLANGLPTMAFGSFDAENLASSLWDFVRYGLTKSANELGIAPHHQVLNQWNVMSSPERLFTTLAHSLTDFKSSSTGIVPKTDPDFLEDSGLTAFTLLNEGTPLVPSTQTFEVRAPFPIQEFVSALNRPEDILNSDADFTLNDSTRRFRLLVPNDVLYSSLDVIEQTTGEESLIQPFDDMCSTPNISGFTYQKEVCLQYTADVLPEADTGASTPWELVSDTPGSVAASSFAGILTYGTTGATRTVYRNNSPLPDHPSLESEARFRIKVLSDASLGTGATEIKFGLSAPGFTVALTFLTSALGERFVLVLDQNNGNVLGSATFDFLDGNYHDYRLVRDPTAGVVRVFIDS